MDVAASVRTALATHPSVHSVRLAGSRASGEAHVLSDWDFAVETEDFEALARDLPSVVAPLRPLAEQWDRYSFIACYMLMFRGPLKVDLLFPDQPREWSPPWSPGPETLDPIDRHFWDWILWIEQKRRGGHGEVVATTLRQMFDLLLRPMGVSAQPATAREAMTAYLRARARLERRFGMSLRSELEPEIRPLVEAEE
jgi:hypothetical protein